MSKEKMPRCGVFSKRSPRHREPKDGAMPLRAATMWQDRAKLARLAVTERGQKRETLRNIPSRVILSEPPGESNFCGTPQKRCGL